MLRFKNLLLFVTSCFFFVSCYTIKPVLDNQNNISENLVFKINLIEEGYSISHGGNSFSRPSKGDKFVFVYITVENKSDKTLDLNFNDFYLVDKITNNKRKLESVMLTTAVNLWGSSDSSIKGNSKKSRKLVFSFQKEQTAELLLINNKPIKIEYQNK